MSYLPTQNWQIPVTPAATLNAVAPATSANTGALQVAAQYATIRVLYGRVRVPALIANVINYQGNWVIQCIWGEGPIQGIESYTFEDKAPTGSVVHYQGTPGQTANATLVAAFAAKGLTYADTLPNIAYSVFTIPASTTTSMPQIAAIVQGRTLYDPRTGLTSFSSNPALAMADFASNAVYGMGRTVDYASVASVASLCDVALGGKPRRAIGLVIDSQQPATTWLDTLSTYAGCWAIVEGTDVSLVADRPASVVKTFNHSLGQIVSLEGLKRRGVAGLPTAIEVRYTDTSVIPWREASAWAYLAGVQAGTAPRRESQVGLLGVQTSEQANREAIERLNKLNLADLSCTLNTFDEALSLQPGDVVSVTHPIGLTAKQFRVQGISSELGRHSLDLLEYDAAVYSDTIITASSTPDTTLPSPLVPPSTPTGLAATEEIYEAGDGSVASRWRITWGTITDLWPIEYAVNITRMDNVGGTNSILVANGTATSGLFVQGPLEDRYFYKIEVTANRTSYSVSSAIAALTVEALGKFLPPADVTGLTSTITPAGLVLNWTPVVDIDFDGYRIKETSWGNGVIQTVATTNANLGYVSAGAHTYLVRAFDRSANESAANASTAVTINAPSVVGSLAGSVGTGDLVLTWLAATASWPIAFYEVRYGGSAWGVGDTLADKVNTTRYLGAVGYTGARTWRIKAVDMAGNYGVETTVVVTVNVAAAPVSFTGQFTGTDAQLNWSTIAGSLPTKYYDIRYGASWAAGTSVAQIDATTFRQPVNWPSRQYWIAAVDTDGNAGAATKNLTLTVVAPASVQATYGIAQSDVVLTWPISTGGSLPVDFYEVRYGAVFSSATFVAKLFTTTLTTAATWTGSRTYWVVPVDVLGNYGTELSVAAVISVPGTVTPASAVIVSDVLLSWATASASLPIDSYEIRHGASWAAGTLVAKTAATDYSVAVNWLGARTFWVAAYDVAGNVGTAGSVVSTITAPVAPTVSQAFSLDTLKLTWTTPSTVLPIKDYEIRYGASFGAGVSLGRVLGTSFSLPVVWAGSRLFWIAAYDINNNLGSAGSTDVNVSIPTAPSVTTQAVDNNVLLYWSGAVGSLPIDTYELRKGATWAGGTLIGKKSGGFTTVFETVAGIFTYWVAAIDTAGNYGTPVSTVVAVASPPDYVLNQTWDSVIAENRLLRSQEFNVAPWGANSVSTATGQTDPNGGSTAIQFTDSDAANYGNIYQNITIAANAIVCFSIYVLKDAVGAATRNPMFRINFVGGAATQYLDIRLDTSTGAFFITPDLAEARRVGGGVIDNGTYWRVWIAGYSTAAAATSLQLSFYPAVGTGLNTYTVVTTGAITVWGAQAHYGSQPTDYNKTVDATALSSNMAYDVDGSRVMGANITETWTTHFANNAWSTPQDQVNSGNTVYIQPGLLPSYYEEVFDYGTTLAATKVAITYNGTAISGSPVLTSTISLSNTSSTGPWTDYAGVWSVYGTAFRWVKVRVSLTGGLYDLAQLTATLDSKIKNDAGVVACLSTDVGGTVVTFNTPFVDVASINVTPNSTTMVTAIYDFTDTPNPTSFKVLLFNQAGARVSGNASWAVRGY